MSSRTTLSDDFTRAVVGRLGAAQNTTDASRQPIHVVYGGAHLFKSETVPKLGRLATHTFETYAPDAKDLSEIFGIDAAFASEIRALVTRKLEAEPIEDFRIDFEDGYGPRSDAEEDGHAISVAEETAIAMGRNMLSHSLEYG